MSKRALFFALAVAAQLLILVAVPAQKIYTRATGRSVLLKIRPVDPYNILSGYYVTLNYEIANLAAFGEQLNNYADEQVYAIVERRADSIWHLVSASPTLPTGLPETQVALHGRQRYSRFAFIEYGIEEFFIPESKRAEIEEKLRANPDQARAEVKVDARGNAALVRLLIADSVYDY